MARCYAPPVMLHMPSSPLIGWFDTAVACRSGLCVMPTSRSRVRRTQFCSLCLSQSWSSCCGQGDACPL